MGGHSCLRLVGTLSNCHAAHKCNVMLSVVELPRAEAQRVETPYSQRNLDGHLTIGRGSDPSTQFFFASEEELRSGGQRCVCTGQLIENQCHPIDSVRIARCCRIARPRSEAVDRTIRNNLRNSRWKIVRLHGSVSHNVASLRGRDFQ